MKVVFVACALLALLALVAFAEECRPNGPPCGLSGRRLRLVSSGCGGSSCGTWGPISTSLSPTRPLTAGRGCIGDCAGLKIVPAGTIRAQCGTESSPCQSATTASSAPAAAPAAPAPSKPAATPAPANTKKASSGDTILDVKPTGQGVQIIKGEKIAFNYLTAGGDWTGACKAEHQSPIDLSTLQAVNTAQQSENQLVFSYTSIPEGAILDNNGRNLKLKANFGYVTKNGNRYYAKSIVFHSPSEHTIGNQRFDVEVQIYHQLENSVANEGMLVVSMLFTNQLQGSNAFLDALQLPDAPTPSDALKAGDQFRITRSLDPNQLPIHGQFAFYVGSRTRPPCETGVLWYVNVQGNPLTVAQFRALAAPFRGAAFPFGNARRTQSIGSRTVLALNM